MTVVTPLSKGPDTTVPPALCFFCFPCTPLLHFSAAPRQHATCRGRSVWNVATTHAIVTVAAPILLLCQARARGEAVCSRRHGRSGNRECNAMVQTHRKVEGLRRAVSPLCPHAAGSITSPHAVPLFQAPKRKAERRCAPSCSKLFKVGSLPSRCKFSVIGASTSAS
jgi:hypothetical protein